ICAPAEVARIISSCAISMDLPVPIDCAETACKPHASSSVSDARKTFSTPPKWSTRRRERVGPSPGVSPSAIHLVARSLVRADDVPCDSIGVRIYHSRATLMCFNLSVPRLKISAISFLNTAPLMWDFDHNTGASSPLRKDFEIHYTVPSACAEALRAGTADIGIIPAITYQTIPDLVVIPDVAIGAKGPVRSILLVSKLPLEKIKTVAADTSSRTSVALLKIIFKKWWRASAG